MLTAATARLRTVRMGHRAQRPGDAGFSLIEVLVGTTLTVIVGALCAVFMVGTTNQATAVAEQSLGGDDARVALERIATLLRTADTPTARPGFAVGRFEVTGPQRIVFYANTDTASRSGSAMRTPPSKIDIYVNNGALMEKVYPPITKYTTYPNAYDYTANYRSTPATTRWLLRSVALASPPAPATVLFSYCTADSDPSVTCTPATSALSIASVVVELTVPGVAGGAPQTLTSTVAITGALS